MFVISEISDMKAELLEMWLLVSVLNAFLMLLIILNLKGIFPGLYEIYHYNYP